MLFRSQLPSAFDSADKTAADADFGEFGGKWQGSVGLETRPRPEPTPLPAEGRALTRCRRIRLLLVDRNKNWLPKLEAPFTRKGHALVIVGAAHLVGPDGLLAMLKAKGYTIEQL